jgi:hypothetical protein
MLQICKELKVITFSKKKFEISIMIIPILKLLLTYQASPSSWCFPQQKKIKFLVNNSKNERKVGNDMLIFCKHTQGRLQY